MKKYKIDLEIQLAVCPKKDVWACKEVIMANQDKRHASSGGTKNKHVCSPSNPEMIKEVRQQRYGGMPHKNISRFSLYQLPPYYSICWITGLKRLLLQVFFLGGRSCKLMNVYHFLPWHQIRQAPRQCLVFMPFPATIRIEITICLPWSLKTLCHWQIA